MTTTTGQNVPVPVHTAWNGCINKKFLLDITGVCDLSAVEELQLCNLGLKDEDLPPELFNELTNLIEMNLSGNKLTQIPHTILLPNLKYLDMSKNCMNNVEWFSRFPKLVDVDIVDNIGLTIDDRYKIMYLLENLQFLDGKRIDDKEKIGEKFTKELMERIKRLFDNQFKQKFKKAISQNNIHKFVQNFVDAAKQKVRFGPNSLKGYRMWRVDSLAKELIEVMVNSSDANLKQYYVGENSNNFIVGDKKNSIKAKKKKVGLPEDEPAKKIRKVELNEQTLITSRESDYEPFVFLQCHSKEKGSDDFSTQVWCCTFEPDINDLTKTTNVVATCGGNTVTIVDCETGKVDYRFEQSNEEFYTAAWTTLTLASGCTNILAAAGCLGFIHLIHVNQALCYGRIKSTSSSIQTMLFSPDIPTHLFVADKLANIFLIDIDVPTVPEYKFAWKKVACFKDLDCNPLKLQVVKPFLLSATEYGLYCWHFDGLLSKGFKSTKSQSPKNIPLCCEITFPNVEDEPMVDALEVVTDDIIATKCAQVGVIFLWQFSKIQNKIFSCATQSQKKKKVEVTLLAELKWSTTPQCYIGISTCRQYFTVMSGDDVGNIWIYDVSKVINKHINSKNSKEALCPMIVPSSVIPFPICSRANGSAITKLQNDKTIYNDIACSADMNCIVVAADNNIVAIFRKK